LTSVLSGSGSGTRERGQGAAIALIGGFDPSGGAGLLRDGWTVARRGGALEVHAVATALTAQGGARPAILGPVDPLRLRAEFERLAALPRLRAVKIGMTPPAAVEPLAWLLSELRARSRPPLVVFDPVLAASDGGILGASAERLLALAHRVDLLTPNMSELDALTGSGISGLSAGSSSVVDRVLALGLPNTAVLVKGERVAPEPGQGRGRDRIRDRLVGFDGSAQVIERAVIEGPDPRGTGCALATAIACELGMGRSMVTAVVAGVAWLDGARRRLRPGSDGRWHISP